MIRYCIPSFAITCLILSRIATADITKGHFEVQVLRPFAQDFAVQQGPGTSPLTSANAGTLVLTRIIDVPCSADCPNPGPLPTTADVTITGLFSGTLASTFPASLPAPLGTPLAQASATYTGPGAMTFTTQSTHVLGTNDFAESQVVVTNMTIGTPVAFAITVNGFAHMPSIGLSGDTSAASATLWISATVNPGQEFEVACVPEPTANALFCLLSGAVLAAKRRKTRLSFSP